MHTVSPHLPGGRLPGGRLFAGVLGIVALALVAATLVTATPADAASRPGPVHGFKQAKETEHGFKLVWRRAARAGKYQ
ncbi:MAG: hypothetical protein ACRDO8_12950, partial [Nocardioidaceae bacterium]